MSLELKVKGLLKDVFFISGSYVADSISTACCVRKYGAHCEATNYQREQMQRQDPFDFIAKSTVEYVIEDASIITGLSIFDSILGISDKKINFHHVYAYGLGFIKYLAAVHNFLLLLEHYKLADIADKPLGLFFDIVDRDHKEHIDSIHSGNLY